MTNQEAIKIAYDMGAHPYSVGSMVSALQKGIEIGKAEQKEIDNADFGERIEGIIKANTDLLKIIKHTTVENALSLMTNWLLKNAPQQVLDDFMTDYSDLKKVLED